MQASNSLGVSDETRIHIENKICREGGPLPECFEEPMENVLTLLEEVMQCSFMLLGEPIKRIGSTYVCFTDYHIFQVYFPIFLDSSVYMKYVNEVLSSVTDIDLDQTSTCADDCSSTASAGETAKLMESLVNDVEAHEDPDEIWQRPHFGYVDEIGGRGWEKVRKLKRGGEEYMAKGYRRRGRWLKREGREKMARGIGEEEVVEER